MEIFFFLGFCTVTVHKKHYCTTKTLHKTKKFRVLFSNLYLFDSEFNRRFLCSVESKKQKKAIFRIIHGAQLRDLYVLFSDHYNFM